MGSRLGVEKIAAGRVGLTLSDYRELVSLGLKWCTGGKAWHSRTKFRPDATRGDGLAAKCLAFIRNFHAGKGRGTRIPDPIKERARGLINQRVKRGALPNPNKLKCLDCGHLGDDRRHEYDHYAGYEGENAVRVEVVCALCHRARHKKGNYGIAA